MSRKIVFLGTGGTIAGRSDVAGDNVGYRAGAVPLGDILRSVSGLEEALAGRTLEAEQVAQLDSKDMTPQVWCRLVQRTVSWLEQQDVDGVVITHGTDTLEETAYFLSRVLPKELLSRKPVVMTCAMRPASARFADGPGNVLDALAVVGASGARGLTVVCAGQIHAGRYVQKVHTYRLDPFESVDTSPAGVVEEGRVRLVGGWDAAIPDGGASLEWVTDWAPRPARVEILVSHSGAGGHMVRALLSDKAPEAPLKGLIVAGTGNGTIHSDLEAALQEAAARGIEVVRVSRCMHGQIVEASHLAGQKFRHYALPATKARIELMLELALR